MNISDFIMGLLIGSAIASAILISMFVRDLEELKKMVDDFVNQMGGKDES